jgi:maltooligosyltrehalose trehalohydrolase
VKTFGHHDGDKWDSTPPNPQSPKTFRASRLSWDLAGSGRGRTLWTLHRRLIELRRTIPALAHLDRQSLAATGIEEEKVLFVDRWCDGSRAIGCFNFNADAVNVDVPFPDMLLSKAIDSADAEWEGPGSLMPQTAEGRRHMTIPPRSFSLYLRGDEQ